nr:sigma-70 family RNA polymerase sigma factor [uncultured Marvinbryantia sp.]
MKPHSQQQEQQKQTFEHFCKQILKNEKNDYHRRLNYRQEHEVLFCELPPSTVEQLSVSDKYFQDTYLFQIKGFEVAVADELLGEALKTLPQDRLEIILLSYFLDMSDPEIAAHLNLIRRTVSHRRKNTLRKLKKIMEGYDDE